MLLKSQRSSLSCAMFTGNAQHGRCQGNNVRLILFAHGGSTSGFKVSNGWNLD